LDWFFVIGFILFGIFLLIIEVVFVPGTTIVGIGGFICLAYGIYDAFVIFGNPIGYVTLGISASALIIGLIYGLKSDAWEGLSLKGSIDSVVNEQMGAYLKEGDMGIALSDLRPVGKALFENEEIEVRTMGDYVGNGQKIKIIKIDHSKIFVNSIS
jgi:membrane-bound ClpP family serine protease|tara:strand:+ start:43637 stop:44104 length:468 start_codon:yes stop_codon:yes gene_type:complete